MAKHDVQTFTAKRIHHICMTADSGAQKAALANLRRGVGRAPGELPQLWGAFLLEMPEEMYGVGGQPSREEWAVYTALTLFALHQQGYDPATEPMHRAGQSLGTAAALLVTNEDELNRILPRLNAAATAPSMAALAHYLRALVQLLRAAGIPLDYAALAGDIFQYQFPEGARRVRLAWGQDFYGTYFQTQSKQNRKQED